MKDKPFREQFIVDENGRKIAVIIPIEKYRKILEDLHDLTVVSEREKEETIDLDKVKRSLALCYKKRKV